MAVFRRDIYISYFWKGGTTEKIKRKRFFFTGQRTDSINPNIENKSIIKLFLCNLPFFLCTEFRKYKHMSSCNTNIYA
jgi:hypothetical protein